MKKTQVQKGKTFLILQDIRSVHNVGAIFRTADAIGITKIYLVGITPTPLDRFGRVRKDLQREALGAEQSVPWEYVADARVVIKKLKKEGVEIVAIEQVVSSIDYKKYKAKDNQSTALVVGNEPVGLPEGLLRLCDSIIEIPMRGSKESLNVTTALGIVLFRLFDK